MPRGGSPTFTYTLPAIYLAVPGTTILATQHNSPLEDIADTLNDPWPTNIGGTGGTDAITSWDAINARGTAIPTAASLDLDAATGANLHLTGAVTVTSVSLGSGNVRETIADSAFILTASASLIVNGSTTTNYTTTAGDYLTFTGDPVGVVRVWVTGFGGTSGVFTGTGPIVRQTSPTLITPAIGAATGTSLAVTGNLSTSAGTLSVTSTAAGPLATITSSDVGASPGPGIELFRNSASPAASDAIGYLNFTGKDTAGNTEAFASIGATITDPTSGSEDSSMSLSVVQGGAGVIVATLAAGFAGRGTPTNDNAAAGFIGEFQSSVVALGSAVSLTTNTDTNITSISLTAGDWDVSGNIAVTPAGTTTMTYVAGGMTGTSATLPAQENYAAVNLPGTVPTLDPSFVVPTQRVSIAATTTIYLVVRPGFAVSTAGGYGAIYARRAR